MAGITQTLKTMPLKLELPWGNPPKPNIWSCKLTSAPKDAPPSGGILYYEIKSPVLNVKNGYRSLMMKFAWTGVQPVIIDVYCTDNGVNLVSLLKIPQYVALEEALVRVWEAITQHRENQEVFFNTKVASVGSPYRQGGITQTLRAKPSKLELPWGNPPKPNIWDCKLLSLGGNAGGGWNLKYKIKSPVLAVDLNMVFHLEAGTDRVLVVVYPQNVTGTEYSSREVRCDIPQDKTTEEGLRIVWDKLSKSVHTALFNTKVASVKKKAKKRKENPKSIDRYVKEYAEQRGYGSAEDIPSNEKGKAFAIAWSRYCSKRPGSPRCKKDKGTYFSNRPNVAKGIAKSMAEKRRKRTKKKASSLSVVDRHIKLASESPSTLRDLFARETEYRSIKLPWGTPPKPSVWKTKLVHSDKHNEAPRLIYLVESPFLLKEVKIVFNLEEIYSVANQRREYVNIAVYTEDSWLPLAQSKPVSHAEFTANMEIVWNKLMWECRGNLYQKLLKPGTKVASKSPATVKELIDLQPQTFQLAWGTPPKKNMWKVVLWERSDNRAVYKVTSPVLNVDLNIEVVKNLIRDTYQLHVIAVNLFTVASPIYLTSYTLDDEQLSLPFDTFMGYVWKSVKLNSTGKIDVFKPNIRIASKSPATVREFFEQRPATFELAWGTPPKKNMWKVALSERYLPTKDQIFYTVKSPVLNLDLSIVALHPSKKFANSDITVRLITKEGELGKTLFHKHFIKNDPELDQSFDAFMSQVWRGVVYQASRHVQVGGSSVFKPNVKVASRKPYATLGEVISQRPETLELPWGNPPKKSLWKVKLVRGGGSTDFYKIESPILKPNVSLELKFRSGHRRKFVTVNQVDGLLLMSWSFEHDDPKLNMSFESFSKTMWNDLRYLKQREFKGLIRNIKVASAGGRYGYTKKVQKDCELAVSQLQKFCRTLCSKQKSKGNRHLEFYRAHAEKSGSPFVKAFVQCHKDIYSEALSKISSSMYGYDEKTVKRCLNNINDLQIRSAMLINKLLDRKTSDSDKIKAYLSEHIEQTGCVWSTCLYSCL